MISNLLSAIGLQTYSNNLNLPAGALVEADNVNIDRVGVITPRRGLKQYGQLPDSLINASQLMVYRDRLLVHYSPNKLVWDTDAMGTFAEINIGASFTPPSGVKRIKSVELNGNLYFTTSNGVKKISAASPSDIGSTTITETGAVRAIDMEATLNLTQAGFFTANSTIGYRVIWGYTDANNNLILGYPSPMVVVSNPSSTSAVVDLIIHTPQGVTSGYFFQIHRTGIYPLGVTPEDELKQVYEGLYDGSSTYSITDVYGEELRVANTNLYTNLISGEGIAKGNLRPPICKDVTLYKNSVFFGNTESNQAITNTLLGDNGLLALGVSSISVIGSTVQIITTGLHGLTGTPQIVLMGTTAISSPVGITTIDGIHTVTSLPFNNTIVIALPSTVTTVGVITGGAEVYKTYLSITKGATVNKYWAIGRQNSNKLQFSATAPTTTLSTVSTTVSTNLFSYSNHGLLNGTSVTLTNIVGTTGISTGVTYYIIEAATNSFKLSTIRNGSSVTLGGSNGTCDATYKTYPYSLHNKYIKMYSADNKVGYFLWFSMDGNLTLPSSLSGVSAGFATVVIDIQYKETYQEIVQKTYDTIFEINDLDPILDSGLTYVTVFTSTSGVATLATTDSSLITPSELVKGIGTRYAPTAPTNNAYYLLSKYSSTAAKNEEITKTLLQAINTNSLEKVYGYYVSTVVGLPGEFTLESRDLDSVAFTLTSNSSSVQTGTFNINLPQTSGNDVLPNRIYFSKTDQPDAVPLANYIDIGPKNKAIKRIVGLRDSLFIFKEEGIYRLYGTDASDFAVVLFDSSANISAPDSCVVLNNQIFLLTTQGVVKVSESGVEIISRPIEDQFQTVKTIPNYAEISFGVTYEADRCYLLFVPYNTGDTTSTRCYRYNTFTQSWTRWTKNYTCGLVNLDKLYFGAVEDNYIEVERKDLNRLDFSDRTTTDKQLVDLTGNQILLNNTRTLKVGDSLVQNQKLTISQVNNLVGKLQLDPLVQLNPNYQLAVPGSNLATFLNILNTDLSSFITVTLSGLNNHADLQNDFNLIVAALNLSNLVFFSNYRESTGTIYIESHIQAINNIANSVTTDDVNSFILGQVDIDKGIPCTVIYSPQHFGDPTTWKQVREARIMFESTNFEGGILGFNTDLDGVFEDIIFTMDGSGTFGGTSFGEFIFGGMGNQIPFRTLIPRAKQRCRFIRARFKHLNARNGFAVFGIAFVFESNSGKGSK